MRNFVRRFRAAWKGTKPTLAPEIIRMYDYNDLKTVHHLTQDVGVAYASDDERWSIYLNNPVVIRRRDLLDMQYELRQYRGRTNETYEALMWLASRDFIFFSDYDGRLPEHRDNRWWTAIINCNDVFNYASADAQEFELTDTLKLKQIAEAHGWIGIMAYATILRDCLPIKPLQTANYWAAREWLVTELGVRPAA